MRCGDVARHDDVIPACVSFRRRWPCAKSEAAYRFSAMNKMLNRRLLLAGGFALAVPAATLPARAEASRIAVAFVGFQSCPYCKVWRTQSEPAFLTSPAFRKLDYYVIDPAEPSMTLQEEYWPQEAQWMLLEFLMSDESALHGHITPRFIIGQNKQIDLTATGNRAWKEKIWPRIQALTESPA